MASSRGRVLVIEDDVEVLATLQEMLTDLGYGVVTAPNAEQGLDAVAAHAPEVVVLDLILPGVSGFDLMSELRQRHPALPIIAITATSQPEVERLVRARGAFGYLAKPIDLDTLDELLAAARGRGPAGGDATVLYVEDNAANVRLVQLALTQRPGVTLLVAATGREGLTLARARRPQLILLDLHLPDMDGIDVLRTLRADAALADIAVVILSAESEPGLPERLRVAGAQGYLEKPLDLARLFDVVDAQLARARRGGS